MSVTLKQWVRNTLDGQPNSATASTWEDNFEHPFLEAVFEMLLTNLKFLYAFKLSLFTNREVGLNHVQCW